MIAELPDGTELEFPDDTPDDVVDRVVKQHLGQSKPQATWGETLQGGVAEVGNLIGTGLTQAMAGLGSVLGAEVEDPNASPEKKARTAASKEKTAEMLKPFFETKEGIRSTMEGLDPTKGKELTTGQRFGKAGVQLAGALATGPVGIAGMMAGGTAREADAMLEQGMPVDKAQLYGAADAALNVGSVALGGFGKSAITQAGSLGAGNMAGDEASHLLANKFREDEGLKLNERDNVDRAISFAMGAVPGYLAQRTAADVEATRKPTTDPDAEAKAAIDAELAKQEANDPLNKPSTLELLDKEAYPEPLGNRTIDPDTKTVTTGMAEDVPTIDFPLRPEAMERDRKFQKLQKDLLAERQILDDYTERKLGVEDIKQQEAAVEQARVKFADYLDQGYGIKEGSDAYRGLYESGKETSLKVERGFDPKAFEQGKKELGLEPMAKEGSDPLTFAKGLEERVRADDYNGALSYIAKQRPNSVEGKVANLLLKVGDTTVRTGAGRNLALESPDGKLSPVGGLYIPAEHKIMMDALSAGDSRSFLHEAVHTATGNALKFFDLGMEGKLSTSERIQARRVRDVYNTVRSLADEKALKQYGMKDTSEFIAEAFSNPAFQTYLKSVELPKNSLKTAWNAFVDSVRGLLGLDAKYNTALAEILSSGSRLIESSTKQTRESQLGKQHIDKVLSQPMGVEKNKLDRFATFDQFRDSLPENLRQSAGKYWTENGRELPKSEATVARNEAQNKAADALIGGDPRAHFLTQDLRSAEEIKGVLEGYKDPKGKYKDINANAARNALASGGFAMSNLVQHPLVHWVTSKTMKAVKQAEIKSETAISETGKGFLAIFKGATPEMQKVLSAKMLAAEGKDVKLEFTPWEQRVADSWNKAKEQALKDFNEARVAKGLEPVEPRLNYLASMFRGNFRMLVQKDGKTVGWINGNSKVELERAKAFFAKDGYEFGNTSRIPYARSKDFQKTIARKMAAFDEVVNILGASDPEVKLFADRMENMISKQAYDYLDFKQHFKEKSGVFGAEGMKAWEDAHRNAIDLWNAQAEYIRMTNQWVAQQSVEADVRAVLSDPKTVNNFPNAHTLARQVYDNAFGRTENRLEILEAIADGYVAAVNADFITNTPGLRNLQKVNPFEAMRGIKNWALYSALAWNPGFVFSQFLQVPAATATMMKYMEEVGLQGNAAMATLWGTSDSVNSHPYMKKFAEQYAKANGEKLPNGFQTELGSYFNKYAEENHIIQPHILEKTDIYSANPTVKKIQQADEMMGKSISWAEEKTRRQAFMTLAHYLASSGLPKEKAAEMAEVATSISMVDYSRHSRAMIYNRLGMLGDMAATVTTFKHNAYTQLAMYGFNKAPKTMFRMALIQLMLAGAVGMYAVDELDDLFNVLRSIAPETMKGVQGPKEALIRNTPEWLAFGGLSAGSRMIVPEGIDIGTKFSMDNLFPDSPIEALFPLFSSLANTAEAVGKAKGAPTFENVAGVAYPMAPAPVKGLMENFIYTDEKGRYVPSKTDQAKTQRSDNEQRIRLSGMRSLDERKESEIAFRTKSNRLRDQEMQQKYLDKMRTYARAGDGESVAENAAKYMINGGQWTQVNTFLDKAGRDRVLTEVQRLSPKSFNTVRQQMQQQELQQFQKDVK